MAEGPDLLGCVVRGKTRAKVVAKAEALYAKLLAGPLRFNFNPEEDSPELEAEFQKAANSPFTPYLESEFREHAEQIVREHRARRAKRAKK